MRHHFFVTGTDTGVGKTTLSALLCAALDAMYWKPIQTGTLEGSDRATVMRLAGKRWQAPADLFADRKCCAII